MVSHYVYQDQFSLILMSILAVKFQLSSIDRGKTVD